MSFSQYTKFTVLCNCCFLLTFINHNYAILSNTGFAELVILLGQLFAVFATIGYFVWVMVRVVKYKIKPTKEQHILFVINSIFLLLLVYYYFLF